MIPRKEAKRLLAAFVDRAAELDGCVGDALAPHEAMSEVADELLAQSDLVLRGAENVEQKARRYLVEGRITVTRVLPSGLVVAEARGTTGTYALGYDPAKREWRCTCPVVGRRTRCSHIAALQLVVVSPNQRGA